MSKNVAIIYDKVNTQFGGAEVVLQALHKIYPEADLITSIYDNKKALWAQSFSIKTSFLQKFSWITTNHKILLPLTPIAFESISLDKYDLIISVTSGEAKGVITKPNQTHICYLLTPPRYLHTHTQQYIERYPVLNWPIMRQITQMILSYLKRWDIVASARPDNYITISHLVAERLKKIYNRTADAVVYPPVISTPTIQEISQLPTFSDEIPRFYLSISRLVKYKRVDLSIKAALKLNQPIVVVGTGEEYEPLTQIAPSRTAIKVKSDSIEEFLQKASSNNKKILFTGNINENEKMTLYKNCEAVLMPGKEDFGITGLEAGIFGKPVIVFYTSGVSELLKDGIHAVHIQSETVQELTYALGKLDALSLNPEKIRENALKYSGAQFSVTLQKTIEKLLKG